MCSHPLSLLCVVTPFFPTRTLCWTPVALWNLLYASFRACARQTFSGLNYEPDHEKIHHRHHFLFAGYKKSSRPTEEKKIGPISSPTQYAEPWLFEPPLRQWANLSGSESNTTWLTAERQRHGYRRYHVWCTYRAMSTWWISHKKNTWWMWTKLNVGTLSVPKWIYLFDHQTLWLTIRLI